MNEANLEVSDEQIEKCFGKYQSCSRACRFKELCSGKAKEQEEEWRRKKYRETGYIEEMDVEANHVAPEFCPDSQQADGGFSAAEVFAAIEQT